MLYDLQWEALNADNLRFSASVECPAQLISLRADKLHRVEVSADVVGHS